jgi:hypothetical protein
MVRQPLKMPSIRRPATQPAVCPKTLALQLQGAFEVRLLRHRLVTSSPDGPGDDERRLDPALR